MRTLYRLHLGRNIGNAGRTVSDADLGAFLRADVSPVFPGFTLTHGLGYWEGAPEPTCVLEVLADEEDRPRVESLAALYAARFAQDAVLLYAIPAEGVAFVSALTEAA